MCIFFVHACDCYTDIKKMPLGKLSKQQIGKGFEVLEEIEAAMDHSSERACLQELSSKFFTTIPHNFGRNRPPVIDNKEIVEKKKEMLMVRSFNDICMHTKQDVRRCCIGLKVSFLLHVL